MNWIPKTMVIFVKYCLLVLYKYSICEQVKNTHTDTHTHIVYIYIFLQFTFPQAGILTGILQAVVLVFA